MTEASVEPILIPINDVIEIIRISKHGNRAVHVIEHVRRLACTVEHIPSPAAYR